MKLSKQSWQVRLTHATWHLHPRSLCSFVWLFVSSVAMLPWSWPALLVRKGLERYGADPFPAIVLAVGGFSAAVIHTIGDYTLSDLWTGAVWESWSWRDVWGVLLVSPIMMAFVVALVAAIWGVIKTVSWGLDRWHERLLRKVREENPEVLPIRRPSVLRSYARAAKEKVCPMMEYTEEESS